jgi:hypothetical protein
MERQGKCEGFFLLWNLSQTLFSFIDISGKPLQNQSTAQWSCFTCTDKDGDQKDNRHFCTFVLSA